MRSLANVKGFLLSLIFFVYIWLDFLLPLFVCFSFVAIFNLFLVIFSSHLPSNKKDVTSTEKQVNKRKTKNEQEKFNVHVFDGETMSYFSKICHPFSVGC